MNPDIRKWARHRLRVIPIDVCCSIQDGLDGVDDAEASVADIVEDLRLGEGLAGPLLAAEMPGLVRKAGMETADRRE